MSKTASSDTSSVMKNDDSNDEEETSSIGSCNTTDNTSRSGTPTILPKKKRKTNGKQKKSYIPQQAPYPTLQYTFSSMVKEKHGKELFGIAFNPYEPNNPTEQGPLFATVGYVQATIYECTPEGGIKPIRVWNDPKSYDKECYYCCAWSIDDRENLLLAVGGRAGIIHVIDVVKGDSISALIGNSSINEMKIHPENPRLLLSMSKDQTLRLWNIRSQACIAIFGSVDGHRDEVLSADFNETGKKIVSCGMDHYLKIWCLDKPEIENAIEKSYWHKNVTSKKSFETCRIAFPEFSTRDIHLNYVDCVRWFKDLILSKSCDNCIVCWKPGRIEDKELRMNENSVTILRRFDYKNCDIWFMRFALDRDMKLLALGNVSGQLYVWDIHHENNDIKRHTLAHPQCERTIRQSAFSLDGNILIAICDDSTIWRWDRPATNKLED